MAEGILIEDMILLICAGGIILSSILAIFYLLFSANPVRYVKKLQGRDTLLTVTVNRDIARISVVAGDIIFERRRIKKGQTIDFVYPTAASAGSARLTVEVESGNARVFEL